MNEEQKVATSPDAMAMYTVGTYRRHDRVVSSAHSIDRHPPKPDPPNVPIFRWRMTRAFERGAIHRIFRTNVGEQ
jgi:hypothetical protein